MLLNLRRLAIPEDRNAPTLTAMAFNSRSHIPGTQLTAMMTDAAASTTITMDASLELKDLVPGAVDQDVQPPTLGFAAVMA